MSEATNSFLMNRRAFIAATSAAVAGLAAPNVFASEIAGVAKVSVGYFGGVSGVARRGGFRQTLMAAERLTTSDPSLIRSGVKLSVRGLWQRPGNRGRVGNYALEVLYAVDGVTERVPFYAWMHSVTKNGPAGSSYTSFVAPVDASGTVNVVVRRGFGEQRADELKFSVTSQANAFMLDRGAYVIALLDAGDRVPDWSSIEMAPDSTPLNFDRESGLIRVRSITGTAAPNFDYIVVTFGSNTPDVDAGKDGATEVETTNAS